MSYEAAAMTSANMAVWLERAGEGNPPSREEVKDTLQIWLPAGWVDEVTDRFLQAMKAAEANRWYDRRTTEERLADWSDGLLTDPHHWRRLSGERRVSRHQLDWLRELPAFLTWLNGERR